MADNDDRALSGLGVGPDEESLYRTLLALPGLTAAELALRVPVSQQRLRHALAELERKAIVTRRSGVPARYQPAPPDMAVEALISSKQEELNRARLDAEHVKTLLRTVPSASEASDLIEVLTSREAVAERLLQLLRAARRSTDVFVKLPFAEPRLDKVEPLESALMTRGVVTRAIYDREALAVPGMLAHLREMAAQGEQARSVTRLPMKLVVIDRHTALVPTNQSDPESTIGSALIVHTSALLDALLELFEIYWERSAAIRPDAWPSQDPAGEASEVVTLLAAGFKDDAIARQLGVSTTTVRRHIRALLQRLGVTTRFQAGLALGREEPRPAAAASSGDDDRAPTERPGA